MNRGYRFATGGNARSFDGPDCGVDGCEREVGHIGRHHRVPLGEVRSPFEDLEAENKRLRRAIEDFILWWDMPPFALDDDERLRDEVDALRGALA